MNSKIMSVQSTKDLVQHAQNFQMMTHETHQEIDQATFRQGMSNLGAAVNVITTDGAAGQAGFTASAVCSVTDSPPTLLVCLNRSASVFETFKCNQVLCVNTLAAHHADYRISLVEKHPCRNDSCVENGRHCSHRHPF